MQNEHQQKNVSELGKRWKTSDCEINKYINFPPIIRKLKYKSTEEKIGNYMYNHMKDNGIKTDKEEYKLTNLLSTHD
jgi:predicted RNA-binding protein